MENVRTLLVVGATFLAFAPAPAGQRAGTGLVTSDTYLAHETGSGHPESPERLRAIVAHLEACGIMARVKRLDPSPAPARCLTTVHSPEYVAEVERACREGKPFLHSPDTPIGARSYEAALLAAGGVLRAIDAVMAGEVRNAFCAVRPPGHHATRTRAMGFCLFNNVAVGARYLRDRHHLRRVLIVDWDVHHGNGTQAAFESDPDVLYFSVHRSPFYPGTGAAEERGSEAGEGLKVNVPLPAGSGDAAYTEAFERSLAPAARRFRPDFVLVSAGFDAHERDPLGGMRVTTAAYGKLTRIVRDIAEEHCDGRLVSVLEGGYEPRALSEAVERHLEELLAAR